MYIVRDTRWENCYGFHYVLDREGCVPYSFTLCKGSNLNVLAFYRQDYNLLDDIRQLLYLSFDFKITEEDPKANLRFISNYRYPRLKKELWDYYDMKREHKLC